MSYQFNWLKIKSIQHIYNEFDQFSTCLNSEICLQIVWDLLTKKLLDNYAQTFIIVLTNKNQKDFQKNDNYYIYSQKLLTCVH